MAGILVVGSLNTDIVVRAPHFPAPGETIQGEDVATMPGGKGANQAVAAARLGASVAMIGRVGADEFGKNLIQNLKQNGVDSTHVLRDDAAATGAAIIIVDSRGQNSIVLSPGANSKVAEGDVKAAFFSDASLLLLQFEIPMEAVLHSARLAKKQGLRVLINPAPAQAVPDELFRNSDFFVPNETELSILTGKPVSGQASAETAARSLVKRGVQNVIVTLGENGALIANKDGAKHIPSFKVDTVDTTGAGDAFIGSLAVALLERKSLEDAVQYACACGALAVTKLGAQSSLPLPDEVNQFLRTHRND